jgi:hypothetical protein
MKTVTLPTKEPPNGYPEEMVKAGEKYLMSISVDREVHLPAQFNWHIFISTMLKASPCSMYDENGNRSIFDDVDE